jgi:signal transduction histidine kinase
MASPTPATRDGGAVELGYATERNQLLGRRLPIGAGLFVLGAAVANGLDLLYAPERWPSIQVVAPAQLLICALALGLSSLAPRSRRWVTVAAATALALSLGAYHRMAQTLLEQYVMGTIVYIAGVAIVLPLGFLGQGTVGAAALAACAIAAGNGAPSALPQAYAWFALGATVVLTTLGARLLDRHRLAAYQRAVALEHAHAAQREEQELSHALLEASTSLNALVGDAAALASALTEQLRSTLDADWAVLLQRREPETVFRVVAVSGLPRGLTGALEARIFDPEKEPALYQRLMQQGAVELSEREARRLLQSSAVDPILAAALAVPVRHQQRVAGLLACCYATRRPSIAPHHHRLIAGIANQAAMALENARLIEEARAANRAKSEFIATVSHELRTPLSVILGYTDLLLEGAFGTLTEQADVVQRIRQQSTQLLDLIQPMLDLSRFEARGIPAVTSDEFRIDELFESLQLSIPSSWSKPGVYLLWHAPIGPDVVIRTDRAKLEMILRNLIHNALKYTEQGEVSLSIDSAIEPGWVRFAVTDTGPGIAPQDLPAIFEMFAQAGTELPRGGGVGLGLYIVKRLTEMLGGHVHVESQPGSGTTFTVVLPIEPRDGVPPRDRSQ